MQAGHHGAPLVLCPSEIRVMNKFQPIKLCVFVEFVTFATSRQIIVGYNVKI